MAELMEKLMASLYIGFSALLIFLSMGAMAGDMTYVTKTTQMCNEVGRQLGENAAVSQSYFTERLADARQSARKNKDDLSKANAAGDKAAADLAKFMVKIHVGMLDIQMKHAEEQRQLYLKQGEALYGKQIRPMAVSVWNETLSMVRSGDAGDVGYAVCLDRFIYSRPRSPSGK